MRRRQRRLRSWWRHEQQSIAAALATALHHSAQRPVPKKQEWEDAEYVASRGQKTDTRAHGGLRPALLAEPHGVEQVLQRTVKQIVDAVPLVPLLDDPVPQTVDTVLEFFRSLDLPVDEQVIAVPKISFDCVSQRLVERRLPQIVEQLVEVPTVLTPRSRSRSSAFQFLMVVVKVLSQDRAHQRLANAFLSGLWSRSSIFLCRLSSRSLTLLLGWVRPHLLVLQMRILLGFFGTFPHRIKSAECRAGGECAAGWARQLIHAERSSNASCQRARGQR